MRLRRLVAPAWSHATARQRLKKCIAPACLRSLLLAATMPWALTMLAAVGKAQATVDLFTIDGQRVVLSAIEQNREEVWNWFNPGVVRGGLDENQYNFLGSWIRVGAGYE